jgi:hypothetical protein
MDLVWINSNCKVAYYILITIIAIDMVSKQAIQVLQQSLLSTAYLDRKSGRDATRVAEFLCHCLPWIADISVERADKHKIDGLQLLTIVMATIPTAVSILTFASTPAN